MAIENVDRERSVVHEKKERKIDYAGFQARKRKKVRGLGYLLCGDLEAGAGALLAIAETLEFTILSGGDIVLQGKDTVR